MALKVTQKPIIYRDIMIDHNLTVPVYVGDTIGDYDVARKAYVSE